MFRIIQVLAVVAALAIPVSALSANPNQPNRFELTASAINIHSCVGVGEIVTYTVLVANISNHDVIATVSPNYIGNNQYTFQYVTSKPHISSSTVNLTSPDGAAYSYMTWQWQQRVKAHATATFGVTVKVPDWNFPLPPSTEPTTGPVYYPQPYDQILNFGVGVLGSTGGTIAGVRSAYCGQG